MSVDMTAHWTDRLRELAAAERVPGATLGIWADGRETLAAHGVLNAATGVDTTADSLFQVGSITKVWTATMIMQLADEGQLIFGRLGDQTPYLSLGGRVTPRVG